MRAQLLSASDGKKAAVPLLVYTIGLGDAAAATAYETADELRMRAFAKRRWRVQACCSASAEGISRGVRSARPRTLLSRLGTGVTEVAGCRRQLAMRGVGYARLAGGKADPRPTARTGGGVRPLHPYIRAFSDRLTMLVCYQEHRPLIHVLHPRSAPSAPRSCRRTAVC